MDKQNLKGIIEAILFACGREVKIAELMSALEIGSKEVIDLINGLIDKLPSDYYEYIICKIKNFKGEQNNLDEDILKDDLNQEKQ